MAPIAPQTSQRSPTATPQCSRSVPYSSLCSHRAFARYRGSPRCCSQCLLSAWLDAEEAPQVPEVGLLRRRPPQPAQPPETTSLPSHRRTREEFQTPHLFLSNSRWNECWRSCSAISQVHSNEVPNRL